MRVDRWEGSDFRAGEMESFEGGSISREPVVGLRGLDGVGHLGGFLGVCSWAVYVRGFGGGSISRGLLGALHVGVFICGIYFLGVLHQGLFGGVYLQGLYLGGLDFRGPTYIGFGSLETYQGRSRVGGSRFWID